VKDSEIDWSQYQEYGWQNTVTDFLLQAANEDESLVIAHMMDRGRHEFEKLKAERGWPEDAAPLWQVRWTYLEKKETT
jgi:hypothetical protein